MDADKNFLVGIFDDEDAVISGVTAVRKSGVKIHEVFSPFRFTDWTKFWGTREAACQSQHSFLG